MLHSIKQLLIAMILVSICFSFGSAITTIAYWQFFERDPIVFIRGTGTLDKQVYVPGERLVNSFLVDKDPVMAKYCAALPGGGMIIVDSQGNPYKIELPRNFNPGGKNLVTFTINVPQTIEKGPAYLYRHVEYQCNPLFTRSVYSERLSLIII